MAGLGVIVIVLGCVAFQYLKGTFVKAFAAIISAICAIAVTFGYFEIVASMILEKSQDSRNPALIPWVHTLCFLLLFILAFAIMQVVAGQLVRKKIEFGLMVERIGRVVCGIFLGLLVAGVLLIAFAMAPLSNELPYQRFAAENPDPQKPGGVLLNADGFVTGWFNLLSRASLSGKRSFSVVHASFLDQVFLNRHVKAEEVSPVAVPGTIVVPKKKASWAASNDLKDAKGQPVAEKTGHKLSIIRVGITSKVLKGGGVFTLSQLRAICVPKTKSKKPLSGKGTNIYPIGYLRSADRLTEKAVTDIIKLEKADIKGKQRWVDLVFYVPEDSVPVLVEFKQNCIAEVPPPVSGEQIPEAEPFIPLSQCSSDVAKLEPVASAKVYGVELGMGTKFLSGLSLKVKDVNEWNELQRYSSIQPAQFEGEKINCVKAELQMAKPADWDERVKAALAGKAKKKRSYRRGRGSGTISKPVKSMLAASKGYKLVSLKCNNPSGGEAIRGDKLPVLLDLSGGVHHPAGLVASAAVGDKLVYQLDYCAVAAGGIEFAEDGTVARSFSESLWLTERARDISEFYVIYLIKSGRKTIITSVKLADSKTASEFEEYEGFVVK